jgi:hypothetical protein
MKHIIYIFLGIEYFILKIGALYQIPIFSIAHSNQNYS